MSVLIRAIECFVMAIFYGLLPIGLGFALGWIMRGEKDENKPQERRLKNDPGME